MDDLTQEIPATSQILMDVPVPTVLPEDTQAIVTSIDGLAQIMREDRDNAIRRERIAPTVIELNADRPRFSSSVRLRVSTIVISSGAALAFLSVGKRSYRFQTAAGAPTVGFPFPIVIEAGYDLQYGEGTPAGAPGASANLYIIGYTDD